MTDRKKPGVAFWTTVAVVLVLAYPLSFGPVLWLATQYPGGEGFPERIAIPLNRFYEPLSVTAGNGPPVIRNAIRWYVRRWIDVADHEFDL
jgi:hypothetical protein